jgi:hypothetical protein
MERKDTDLIGRIIAVRMDTIRPRTHYKLATVLSPDPEGSAASIEFYNGRKATYQYDQLLTLYPAKVIQQKLLSNWDIRSPDFKTILKVWRLTSQNRQVEALRLAMDNETILFFCTTDCAKWLDMHQQMSKKNTMGIKKTK